MRAGLVLLLVALAPGRVCGDENAGEVARLRGENAALRERVERLEAENAELRVLAGLAPAAGAEAASAARVATVYDDARELTSVTGRVSRLEAIEGARGRHWMRLRYEHPGRQAAAVAGVELEIEASSAREAYRGARSLRLSIDGVGAECPVVGYQATPMTVGSGQRQVGTREVVVVRIPLETLKRVAAARDVQGTLGPTVFRLTPDQIVDFRVFQRRLEG